MRAGLSGECQILRRGVSPHYWKDAQKQSGHDPLLTADGWLRTGDLATRNRLGMIRLVGRMKDVIKSGGYSVYVRELEEAIAAHPAVARAAAFGLPHKEKGETPAAAVELHTSFAVTETELVDWCRNRLAPYKAPRRIWILEAGALPQNHTGKLLRRELRDRFAAETN
jgi:acyl-CoA synthetase (AMP-forming)/AMP-acid ligase II